MKKWLSLLLCLVCLFSFSAAALAEDDVFLSRIQGTFVELFPVLSEEQYHDAWLNAVAPLVGEEVAEDTVAALLSMCTGDLYGQEAIDAYAANPESMRFNSYYLGGVAKMTVEGSVISGVDADGSEIFRHEYVPMDVENENGFLFYQTADADAGQFTYFAFSPDTMADTWHLEFRYAEDLNDLQSWFEGSYAYWNVGAIAEDATEEQVLPAIHLFATENLSVEE